MFSGRFGRASLYGSTVTAALVIAVSPAAATAETQTVQFFIPAQSLGAALRAFGLSSGQSVIFSEDEVRGKHSAALIGSFTDDDAIARLLKGSGLISRRTSGGVIYLATTTSSTPTKTFGGPVETATRGVAKATPNGTEIVVTARFQALLLATDFEKNSDTIVESIVADEAGQLPDTSVTEVLQRVAGVTITRFGSLSSPDQFAFEGVGVQVRGLSQIAGLLNGEEVDSANGGYGLNFNQIAPELVASVNVYKQSAADLVESGIGGAIDLRTRMPFDYKKPELDLSLGDSYGDFSRRGSPQASVLATSQWDTPIGEIGTILDLAYSQYYYADSFFRVQPYFQEGLNGDNVYVPGGFTYGNDEFDRQRKGAYLAVQWRPSSDLTLYQTDFVSNYHQTNSGGDVFVSQNCCATPGANDTFNSKGVFQSGSIFYGTAAAPGVSGGVGNSNTYTPSDSTTADFNQGFVWTPNQKLHLSGAAELVQSGNWAGDYGLGVGTSSSFDEEDLGSLTGPIPHFAIPGANLTNPATSTVDDVVWNDIRNHAQQIALNLDADLDLGGGFFNDFKAGIRYQTRDEKDTFNGTWWSPTDDGSNGCNSSGCPPQLTVAASPASDFHLYRFPNFFKGAATAPSSYWMYTNNSPGALQHVLATYAVNLRYDDTFGNTPNDYNTKEQTVDGYVEVKFGHDRSGWSPPFTGNVGVRVVGNDIQSSGLYTVSGGVPFYATTAAANAAYQAVGGAADIAADPSLADQGAQTLTSTSAIRTLGKTYIYALPDINLAFKPSSQWVIRLAAGQTLSQPNFSDIRTNGSVSVGSTVTNPNQAALSAYVQAAQGPNAVVPQLANILSNLSYNSGNTKLNPEISNNEDISIEWYPNCLTAARVDVFNKQIRNEIVYNTNSVEETVPSSIGSINESVISDSDYNATKLATLTGVEIAGRTYFDVLPGALKGLGVEANYSIINSHSPGTLASGMDGDPITGLPIVGLSQTNYNIELLYDLGLWDARVAYSWRSKYLATTTGNGTTGSYLSPITGATIAYSLPIFAAATGQLDAHISYKINGHIAVAFDGSNLTNAISKTLQEILPGQFEPRSWFMNDVRYAARLTAKF